MTKAKRIPYRLNTDGVDDLSVVEIAAILRGADEMIGIGGRNLLSKLLKGSKVKIIFDHDLNHSPVYGYYHDQTITDVTHRIDKAIYLGYLKLEYQGKLPVLSFTDKGWMIERETMANELFFKISECVEMSDFHFCEKLKDRNRDLILLLLEKISLSADKSFIPFLVSWREIEYKKVRDEIDSTLRIIEERGKEYESR